MKEQFKYHFGKFFKKFILIKENLQTEFYIRFLNKELKKIIISNRINLDNIGTIFTENEFQENDYGMDKEIFSHINKKIKNYPTYSDLIVYTSSFLENRSINYLEIGVSVLKNFMQVNNQFNNSHLVAYDINPPTHKFLKLFKKEQEKLYTSNHKNKITYFQGSVLDIKDTEEFKSIFKEKFDIVFSDALHTPQGIESEYQHIISGSLQSDFILYFDDLDFPGIQEAVSKIYLDLQKSYSKLFFTTFKVYGWVGQNEKMHRNGIISTLNFYNIFKTNNVKLPSLKLEKNSNSKL